MSPHGTDTTPCARVDRLYKKHTLRPADKVFEKLKAEKIPPNYSLRMTQLTAAVIRPQILTLEKRVRIYDRRYKAVEAKLNQVPHIVVPKQLPQVRSPRCTPFAGVVLPTQSPHCLASGAPGWLRLFGSGADRSWRRRPSTRVFETRCCARAAYRSGGSAARDL